MLYTAPQIKAADGGKKERKSDKHGSIMLLEACFACIDILTDDLYHMMKHISSDGSVFFMNYFCPHPQGTVAHLIVLMRIKMKQIT